MRRVRSFVKKIRPGDHIVLFYESPAFKHEVLFTYLKSGLDKGITALYYSHKEPADDILRGMRSFGIEVERYARAGLFELWEITPDLQPVAAPLSVDQPTRAQPSSDELSSIDPLSDDPFARLTAYLEGKTVKEPLVVVADDPLQNMDAEMAVNYEKFHSLRMHYTPISMVCTYSMDQVSWEGDFFLDLVKTHRHIIIQTSGKMMTLQHHSRKP